MKRKWTRGGPDGEIHTQHKGETWRVRKNYDHNDRHTGEYRIEVKKKNAYSGHDWHWHDTVHGKENAKSRLPEDVQEEMTTTADAGIPHDTRDMGPMLPKHILRRRLGIPINMTDRRRKKNRPPVLLTRFSKYNG